MTKQRTGDELIVFDDMPIGKSLGTTGAGTHQTCSTTPYEAPTASSSYQPHWALI